VGAGLRTATPSCSLLATQRLAPTFIEGRVLYFFLLHVTSRRTMTRTAYLVLASLTLTLPACARRYRVEGLVLEVKPTEKMMVVSHRAIPGYMDGMAMPFRVRTTTELKSIAPGDRVAFQLVVKGRSSHAERIQAEPLPEVANAGRGETPVPLRVPPEKLALGMRVPDFFLLDQLARPVHLSDFNGKIVAVNFIYTRCPLPEVCPRLSSHFAHLQRRFRQQMGSDLVLISITLDSQYDTAPVLAEYAQRWGAEPNHWHFLTGTADDVRQVANRFGMIYWPEEGLLTHTSQTGIIGRDGRLVALIEGSSYEEAQLGDLIARQLEASHDSHRHSLAVVR
jgi:protein SCO1